jgi:hypothetical protein
VVFKIVGVSRSLWPYRFTHGYCLLWLLVSYPLMKRCLSSPLYSSFEYPLSQLKSSKLVQMCMNWKDIVISSIPFSRWHDPMWIMSIYFIFLSVPQVSPKFFHNSLSYQNRSIWLCKPNYPILDTGHIWLLGQIPEALARHIRPLPYLELM